MYTKYDQRGYTEYQIYNKQFVCIVNKNNSSLIFHLFKNMHTHFYQCFKKNCFFSSKWDKSLSR